MRIETIFKTTEFSITPIENSSVSRSVIFEIEYKGFFGLLYIMNRKFEKLNKFNFFLYSMVKKITKKDYYKLRIVDYDNLMEGNNLNKI